MPDRVPHAGLDGLDGASAYEIAVNKGFRGTEIEWLASLKGKDGEDGQDGKDADPVEVEAAIQAAVNKAVAGIPLPKDGQDGKDGEDGRDGIDGKDAPAPPARAAWNATFTRDADELANRVLLRCTDPKQRPWEITPVRDARGLMTEALLTPIE